MDFASIFEQYNLKDIPGFDGKYAISTDGRIWSYYKKDWKHLKTSADGYKLADLHRSHQRKHTIHYVHRLVMLTHGPSTPENHIVHHKNAVRIDNRLDNLMWATPAENHRYAVECGNLKVPGKGKAHNQAKLTEDKVHQIRSLAKNGEAYRDIAKLYDIALSTVSSIVNKYTWSHI